MDAVFKKKLYICKLKFECKKLLTTWIETLSVR